MAFPGEPPPLYEESEAAQRPGETSQTSTGEVAKALSSGSTVQDGGGGEGNGGSGDWEGNHGNGD